MEQAGWWKVLVPSLFSPYTYGQGVHSPAHRLILDTKHFCPCGDPIVAALYVAEAAGYINAELLALLDLRMRRPDVT